MCVGAEVAVFRLVLPVILAITTSVELVTVKNLNRNPLKRTKFYLRVELAICAIALPEWTCLFWHDDGSAGYWKAPCKKGFLNAVIIWSGAPALTPVPCTSLKVNWTLVNVIWECECEYELELTLTAAYLNMLTHSSTRHTCPRTPVQSLRLYCVFVWHGTPTRNTRPSFRCFHELFSLHCASVKVTWKFNFNIFTWFRCSVFLCSVGQ